MTDQNLPTNNWTTNRSTEWKTDRTGHRELTLPIILGIRTVNQLALALALLTASGKSNFQCFFSIYSYIFLAKAIYFSFLSIFYFYFCFYVYVSTYLSISCAWLVVYIVLSFYFYLSLYLFRVWLGW